MSDVMNPLRRRLLLAFALVVNFAAWIFILREVLLPLVSD